MNIDVDAMRARVRSTDFERGTPEQIEQWRRHDAGSRHSLVIEGMNPEADEDALFAMFMEEGVPPELASNMIDEMLHQDAARRAA